MFQFNMYKQSPIAFKSIVVCSVANNNVVDVFKGVMDLAFPFNNIFTSSLVFFYFPYVW